MYKSLITAALMTLSLGAGFTGSAFAAAPALAPECQANAPLDLRVKAALAKPDRPADQRAKDDNRLSETQFVLAHVKPGDHVLDLGAGGGYASMVLSAAICDGQVDSQNPPQWVGSDKAQAARQALATARPNLHLLTVDFDKVPVPNKPYDVIFIGTIYHDTYNMPGHDAVAMDKALLAALKPGGIVILTDHKAAADKGSSETNTLHRIEEATVLSDFKTAGFELVEDSAALADPTDDHSLKIFDPAIRGKTDRMALVFRKPK